MGALDNAVCPSAVANEAGIRVRLFHEESKGTPAEIVKKCSVAGVERSASGGCARAVSLRPGERNSEKDKDEERRPHPMRGPVSLC